MPAMTTSSENANEPPRENQCLTCYGTGEIVGEAGAAVCPDCLGHGGAPTGMAMEWRLRDLERTHAGHTGGCSEDVAWLVHELRKHRAALVEVLTRCQDAGDSSPLFGELRHLTNVALGLYPTTKP
jgi:hypothetical protein